MIEIRRLTDQGAVVVGRLTLAADGSVDFSGCPPDVAQFLQRFAVLDHDRRVRDWQIASG